MNYTCYFNKIRLLPKGLSLFEMGPRPWSQAVLLLLLILPLFLSGQSMHPNDLLFVDGLWLQRDSLPYTGLIEEKSDKGRTLFICTARNGKTDGVCKRFYEKGQLQFMMQYKMGEPEGAFVEYYPNGELKFRGQWQEQAREGGNWMSQVDYAYYAEGQYITKVKNKVRLLFINEQGLSGFYNRQLCPWQINGYRVFDKAAQDFGIFIWDSRELQSPAESNRQALPIKKVDRID